MKNAFTMVELIFVIVILGILAAVAIPRLNATRDDAYTSSLAYNITSGATEIASYAMSKGSVDPDLTVMSNGMKALVNTQNAISDPSTKKVTVPVGNVSDCVVIQIVTSGNDEVLNITEGTPGSDEKCLKLQNLIDSNDYPMTLRGTNVVL